MPEPTQAAAAAADSNVAGDPAQSRYWLAAYTRSRHEAQVAKQLGQKKLEYLLPTYNKMRRLQIPQGTGRTPVELSSAAD